MKRSIVIGILVLAVLLFAATVFAEVPTGDPEGLVTCSGADCDACHLISLGNEILEFFVQIAVFIAVLMFSWGGFLMVMSAGNPGQVTKGTQKMTDAVVGIVIVLAAWLMINTALKLVVDEQTLGPWNDIKCALPVSESTATAASPIFEPTFTQQQIRERIAGTAKYEDWMCEYAAANGIPDQCDMLLAMAATESGGNGALVSPKGAIGVMQIMPSTARGIDSQTFKGSDEAVQSNLHLPEVNIRAGTMYYAELLAHYNGDTRKAIAAYNGGYEANYPSENCLGLARWECRWDDDAHTDSNEGFAETRNYVANVTKILEEMNKE